MTEALDLDSIFASVTEYRSDYDSGYIYSGWKNGRSYEIIRVLDNTTEIATNVTDLETDWTNRLALTYT